MAAGAGAQSSGGRRWDLPSRRRLPRYRVQAPLDVTVLRSGIPDTVPGRSVNLCERGIAAMLAGELSPGEAVGVEICLSSAEAPLRTRALVRHQHKLHCGMEFVGLSVAQQMAIRQWATDTNAKIEETTKKTIRSSGVGAGSARETGAATGGPGPPAARMWHRGWALWLLVAAVLVAIFWWRWNRGWEELESGLPLSEASATGQLRVQVPTEVMEKLLLHRVDPDYPEAARSAKLHGVIVLDIVVGRDGSVVEIRPLSGPDVLARAAMETVRWWRFAPYRVNGEPRVVETTVAVEFKP
jgi:TonB family protein